MVPIGEQLRQARMEKGIDLKTVEEATKIRFKYLEALEDGNLRNLPGRVYALGFLRTYARFLGLNTEHLVDQLRVELTKEDLPTSETNSTSRVPSGAEPRSGNRAALVVILALIVVAITLLIFWRLSDENLPENSGPPADVTVQIPATEAKPDYTPPAQPSQKETPAEMEIVLSVVSDRCWVSVEVDGQPVFSGTLYAGSEKKFTGKNSIKIKLGNAGVAKIVYQGDDIGSLGAVGQVVTKEFLNTL